jgi:ankyrin repeat protein
MAIHYACLYGHWACTQVMMEPRWVVQNGGCLKPLAQAIITDMHGQNRYIDARTCAGLTPLHMAAWAGHVEVAKILLQNGAFLNPKIVFSSPSTSSVLPGSTPTHLATRKNRIHVVKALLTSYVRLSSFYITVSQDFVETSWFAFGCEGSHSSIETDVHQFGVFHARILLIKTLSAGKRGVEPFRKIRDSQCTVQTDNGSICFACRPSSHR